jgi:hypothetical protein
MSLLALALASMLMLWVCLCFTVGNEVCTLLGPILPELCMLAL